MGWGRRLAAALRLSFGLRERVGKIGTWHFVSSDSEDLQNNFSETKHSRKQELALWHLVNRLVPENA